MGQSGCRTLVLHAVITHRYDAGSCHPGRDVSVRQEPSADLRPDSLTCPRQAVTFARWKSPLAPTIRVMRPIWPTSSSVQFGRRRSLITRPPRWALEPRTAEWAHGEASDGRLVLVAANEDDCPVAYIDLEPNGHIDRVFCAPEAAGRGIASRLYDYRMAKVLDLL